MRMLTVLAVPALLAAAPVDYSRIVTVTPDGGFRMGNPAAKLTLVEYASLTCGHCKHFHDESTPALVRDYVATGRVAFEMRNLVINGADIAAATLARCDGAARYFRRVEVLYKTQAQWLDPFTKLTDAQGKQIAAQPPARQLAALANAGGLDRFVAARGIAPARVAQCLADPKLQAQLDGLSKAAARDGVSGTPTFLLNGRMVDGNEWAQVKAALDAAQL